jgi:Sulfotransferase domain
MLPNFLIAGAAKAGTTSLYEYLHQHPDVFMSPLKEPGYYWSEAPTLEDAPVRTAEEYERLFDGVTTEHAIGEATPRYLQSPTAAARIQRDIPNARIIIALRNPADRAYSSYLGRLRGGRERRSVEEAMQPGTYYFETSLYYESLLRFYERFKRIKVVLFDDLRADSRAVMRDIYEFLDVDPAFEPDVSVRHNKAAVPRSRLMNSLFISGTGFLRRIAPAFLRNRGLTPRLHPLLLGPAAPLPPAIRERLLLQFRDDIEKTASLIGRDLSSWAGGV